MNSPSNSHLSPLRRMLSDITAEEPDQSMGQRFPRVNTPTRKVLADALSPLAQDAVHTPPRASRRGATICDVLRDRAQADGIRPFMQVWAEGEGVVLTLSFTEVQVRVDVAAAALRHAGVPRAACVAMLSHSTVQCFVYTLAIFAIGGAAAQLNWRQTDDQLAAMLGSSDATALVASARLAQPAHLLASRQSIALLFLEPPPFSQDGPSHLLPQLNGDGVPTSASPPSRDTSSPPLPHSRALVMFTSGSTGKPKAVPLTHAGLLWTFEQRARLCPEALAQPNAGTLCFLPNFHVIGLANNFLFNLYAGIRCVVHRDAGSCAVTAALLVEACASVKPTILDTVPSLVEDMLALLEAGHASAGCLSRLHHVLAGGSPLSEPRLLPKLDRHGVVLWPHYGQTEVGGPVLIGGLHGSLRAMRPLPDAEFEMIDERGEVVARDAHGAREGELVWLRLPCAHHGYLGAERAAAARLAVPGPPRQRLATGDIFRTRVVSGNEWLEFVCRKVRPPCGRSPLCAPLCPTAPHCAPLRPTAPHCATHAPPALGRALCTRLRHAPPQHPWTRVCAQDELLLLSTGEMVNPVTVEDVLGAALQGSGVGRVCVAGQHRPLPVVFLEANATLDQEALEASVEAANRAVPAYARIRASRVHTMAPGSLPLIPHKQTVARRVVEEALAGVMDQMDLTLRRGGQAPSVGSGFAQPSGKETAVQDSLSLAVGAPVSSRSDLAILGHIQAFGMLSVVLTHSFQLRGALDPQRDALQRCRLPCQLLEALAHRTAMPIFVAALGLQDSGWMGSAPPSAADLLRASVRFILLYVFAHFAQEAAGFGFGFVNPCDRWRWKADGATLSAEEHTPLNAGHLWFLMLVSALRLWRAAALYATGSQQRKRCDRAAAICAVLVYVGAARPEATEPVIGTGDPFPLVWNALFFPLSLDATSELWGGFHVRFPSLDACFLVAIYFAFPVLLPLACKSIDFDLGATRSRAWRGAAAVLFASMCFVSHAWGAEAMLRGPPCYLMPIVGCTTNGLTYVGAAASGAVAGVEWWRWAQLAQITRSLWHLLTTAALLACLIEAVPRSPTSVSQLGLLSVSSYIWHMPCAPARRTARPRPVAARPSLLSRHARSTAHHPIPTTPHPDQTKSRPRTTS